MGMIYQQLGDRQKAIETYNQAIPIVHALGDRATESLMMDNMGAAYVEAGESQKAIDILNQAISLQTGLANSRQRSHGAHQHWHCVSQAGR